MRFLGVLCAGIALLGFFGVLMGEEAKPSPQGQLRLLISPGETTQTITRPRDDQAVQKGEMIITCESMTFGVQDGFVFRNGTLENVTGYYSFAEIAVAFSGKSISISSPTPGKPLKDFQFRPKVGDASKD